MTAMPRLMKQSIKIVMWKILRGGATFIPGATSIPESRVDQSRTIYYKNQVIFNSAGPKVANLND